MGEGARSAGRRGVLRELAKDGPRAVPQMARARPVSRQYMQKVVNGLRADGLVEFLENPAHRRSPLVELTAKGNVYVQRLARREQVLLGQLATGLDLVDLHTAADILRKLRAGFRSERWKELLRASR
jgi:DNA-binding MarR family transcriptional regulator